jgi:hypothetical protein
MLREVGGVGQAEPESARGDVGSYSNEPEQPDAGRCFEGREAVELSILMGFYK